MIKEVGFVTEKRKTPRKDASPLSLKDIVPPGWHNDSPAFPGDPVFDWESKPEPPRDVRELRHLSSAVPKQRKNA